MDLKGSDGGEVAVEVDGSSAIVRRFVRGDGPDELIAWYEGGGTTSRRFAGLDERGSVISATDGSGTLIGINAYDEYGKPGASNVGRMQYTGQMWLPEANLYYYKARMYSPPLGRFPQPDPIGTAGGLNLYAYTGNDPINFSDPLGLQCQGNCSPIFVIGAAASNLLGGGNGGERWQRLQLDVPIEDGGGVAGGPGHDYSVKSEVCARTLSSTEMRDLLSKFAVPGHAGEAVTTRNYWAWGGPIPGRVRVTFSRGGLRVTNITISGEHPFSGQIQRDILAENGATVITTHGSGNAQADGWDAIGMLRDDINQFAGPRIFNSLDAQAAAYAKAHFQGC